MSKCQGESDTYLNHDCYTYLKDKFKDTSLSTHKEKNFKATVQELKSELPDSDSFSTLLREITSRVTNSGVFFSGNPRIACNYINFLINEKMRKDHMHKNLSYYDTIKNFVRELYIKTNGSYHDGKVCDIDITPLDDNLYGKMKDLYELYSLYNELQWTHKDNINYKCDPYGNMIRIHNEAIKYHELEDEKLIKKLLILKDMTSKITLPDYKKCYHRMSHFHEPELYLKKIEDEKEKKRLEEEAILKKQQEEREEQEQREREKQLKSELALTGEVSNTLRGFQTTENDVLSPTLRNREEGLSENSISQRGQQYLEGNKFTYPQTHLLDTFGRQKEELEQLDVKSHEIKSNHISETDTPGVFGSLQNSISSFIRDVEPAPVLGVSGGMGVLFLLFKYTPVGSFFGGRRRRMHQIPSSFRGFPPGDFANFQEYDGGFIGYGPMYPLAE